MNESHRLEAHHATSEVGNLVAHEKVKQDTKKDLKSLSTDIERKQQLKQEILALVEKLGMRFYYQGEEVSLGDVDIDSIKNWCFGDIHWYIEDDEDSSKVLQLLVDYYQGKKILGLYEGIEEVHNGESGDMSSNPHASTTFKDTGLLNKLISWDDKDIVLEYRKTKEELIQKYVRAIKVHGLESPQFINAYKDYLYLVILIRNDGIFRQLENNSDSDIFIFHGGAGHFIQDPRIKKMKDTLVCIPRLINEVLAELNENEEYATVDAATRKIEDNLDLEDYEEWKKTYIYNCGDPFEN